MNTISKIITSLHKETVLSKRAVILSREITKMLPKKIKDVLDIGCGDGFIGKAIKRGRKGLNVYGVEVLKRDKCMIPYELFNGIKLPFKNNSVDCCLLIDVLHHTKDLNKLVKEASRVSKKYIVIKDHFCENKLAFTVLKIMDWIGNNGYHVNLTYNYKSRTQWNKIFKINKLKIISIREKLNIHPWYLRIIFSNNLHFMVLLKKSLS